MRRALPIAAALTALTLTAPGAALANQGHHHHKAKHRAHHAQVHFRHLGARTSTTTTGTGTGTQPTPGAPTTPPTTPPAPENAGTVASYTNGVLTLTLTDGSSVSGKVTANTRIECVSATPTSPPVGQGNDEGAPGDDNGLGDDQSGGDGNQSDPGQGNPGQGQGDQTPQGQGGQDDGGDGGNPSTTPATPSGPPCDSSALVNGATVRAAELRIGPGGTEFESIELVR